MRVFRRGAPSCLCSLLVCGNAASQAVLAASAPIVCIDPGHPSETSAGRVRLHGTTEVHIAWEVASRLRERLAHRGVRVCMTKSAETEFVTNADRAERANRAGALLLVRLHTDASRGRGFALYYPDRQGTTKGVTGPSASVIERSRRAAEAVHGGMAAVLQGALPDNGVRGDSRTFVGRRQGALTGSIFSRVPVVLVEMVVLTDSADASFIKTDAGQERMAEAIADGVRRFVAAPTREGTRP